MRVANSKLRKDIPWKFVILMCTLALFLMGADNGEQRGDESDALQDQQKNLRAQIETLRLEQDYLLFQKTMYAVDSKYLILNLSAKNGQLWYRNRLLKDFRFTLSGKFTEDTLKQGMLVLTKKTEGKGGRHTLIFGKTLLIKQVRSRVSVKDAGINCLFLTTPELASVFFAVEEGALAYLLR